MKSFLKQLMPLGITATIFFALLTSLKYALYYIGPDNPWMSYLYFYGIGIPIYIFMAVLLIRLKAIRLSHRPDRIFLTVITLGFFTLVTWHAVWIWLSLTLPYKGIL